MNVSQRFFAARTNSKKGKTRLLLHIINLISQLNENAPSTETERIDCIDKCHSGLWDAVTSLSKTAVLVVLTSQRDANISFHSYRPCQC